MIAGITGHQSLGDVQTVEWIRKTIDEQVSRFSISCGLSSLAVGADQVFARVLLTRRVRVEAVIPCAGYERTFTDDSTRAEFDELLRNASNVHQLPFSTPTEEAFLAAGKWIVSNCDLLLAVWDGKPARGLGGTGDVVQFAKDSHRRLIHLNPINRSLDLSLADG